MHIKGFHGVSLIDFPGKLCSVLFTGGCDFQCPFCQNPDLVAGHRSLPDMPMEHVLARLAERKGFIDGVSITGGEPTIHSDLDTLVAEIKNLGLLVKLDTNGNNPAVMESLLSKGLLDFIAMDVKAGPDQYDKVAGVRVDLNRIKTTIRLVMSSGVQYEFRTPCVPGLVGELEIAAIGELVKSADHWYLHQFRGIATLDPAFGEVEPHSPETMHRLAELARAYVKNVGLRGIAPQQI